MLRKLSDDEARSLEDSLAQNGLPFKSHKKAEKFFFNKRDEDLATLRKLNQDYPHLNLDFKAQSLKRLELFYFDAFVDKKMSITIPKQSFEQLLSIYMRQVFVSNEMAEWIVFENSFAEGRYDLGVLYGYGSLGKEHYADNLDQKENNTSRSFLYNRFMEFVPDEMANDVQ